MQTRFFWIGLLLSFVIACGSKKEGDGGGGGGDVKWPEKPASGAPVALEFIGLVGQGDRMEANMRIFNFSDKPVTRINMTLDYLDATGKKLKDFPWGQSGPSLVGPKEYKDKEMGAFIPAETKKVTATVKDVEFGDGSKWP